MAEFDKNSIVSKLRDPLRFTRNEPLCAQAADRIEELERELAESERRADARLEAIQEEQAKNRKLQDQLRAAREQLTRIAPSAELNTEENQHGPAGRLPDVASRVSPEAYTDEALYKAYQEGCTSASAEGVAYRPTEKDRLIAGLRAVADLFAPSSSALPRDVGGAVAKEEWQNINPATLEPWYCHWLDALTADGLHAKADIATVLAILSKRIEGKNKLLGSAPPSHEQRLAPVAWLLAGSEWKDDQFIRDGETAQRRFEAWTRDEPEATIRLTALVDAAQVARSAIRRGE